jgi:hypothetical protein
LELLVVLAVGIVLDAVGLGLGLAETEEQLSALVLLRRSSTGNVHGDQEKQGGFWKLQQYNTLLTKYHLISEALP